MNTNHAKKWDHSTMTAAPDREKSVTVKVHKQGWITKGEKMLYSLVGIFLLLAGCYIVFFSSSTDTLNRELQSLEQTVQTQQVVNEGLLFEVKELSRPERITKIAEDNGLKIQNAKVKQARAINNN